jgi:hypothetical protein
MSTFIATSSLQRVLVKLGIPPAIKLRPVTRFVSRSRKFASAPAEQMNALDLGECIEWRSWLWTKPVDWVLDDRSRFRGEFGVTLQEILPTAASQL